MSINDFLCFVRWYFKYVGKTHFDDSLPVMQTVIKVRKKERLPLIVFAYLLMMVSLLLFWMLPPIGFLLAIALIVAAIGVLFICRFSLIYYFIAFIKYSVRNASINDRVIVEECVLSNPKNDIRKMISDYFRVVDVKGNMFALRFYLAQKTKRGSKRAKLSRKDVAVLKITANKVFLDRQEMCSIKIMDASGLQKLLCEAHKCLGFQE